MDRFPYRFGVNDLLGLGIDLQPEQESAVEDPACEIITVVPLPEIGGDGYWMDGFWRDENGQPVYLPVPITSLPATERVSYPTVRDGQKVLVQRTIAEDLADQVADKKQYAGRVEPERVFDAARAFGHVQGPDMLGYYTPWSVDDDLQGRYVWDTWRVTPEQARTYARCVEQALVDSHYYDLLAFLDAENCGFDIEFDSASDEERAHWEEIRKNVLADDGEDLKDPALFTPKLVLPRDLQYTWDALLDHSRRGWDAWIQAHPASERAAIKNDWENPWL